MHEAARIVSELLTYLSDMAQPGVSLLRLELAAEKYLAEVGAESANKGYLPSWSKTPYPNILCLSVNDTISHGIPSEYVLKEGDILTIDTGIVKSGFYGDAALTIPIGKISSRDERLLLYAKRALYVGIEQIAPGKDVSCIGRAIQNFVVRRGFVVVKTLDGHFIGNKMHLDPSIPHNDVGIDDTATKFKVGDIICLEPHITYKDQWGVKQDDGWTISSRDGKNSAVFEHMIEVTETGYKILTTHIDPPEAFSVD